MSTAPLRPPPLPGSSANGRRAEENKRMAPAIVGLAVLASVTGLFVFMGAFLLLASDSCGAHHCNDALVNWAVYIAALGPIVVFVAALVTTLVLLFRKHRAAAVVPWVSLALLVLCLLTGYFMMKVATGT